MQQVNLYLPEFQPRQEPLMATQMGVICGAFVGLLLLISLVAGWQNRGAAEKITEAQAEVNRLKAQNQQLRNQRPKSQKAQLEQQIANLQQQLARRQRLESLMADQDLGNAAGFSMQMESLARQSLRTLSLSSFDIREGGRYVELSGWVRSADQVPLYIQQLQREPSFQRVGFGVLTIEKSKKRSDALHFSVANPDMEAGAG